MEKFILAKDSVKNVKRFNLTGRTIEFKIKPVPANEEPISWVRAAVNQIIEKATENLQPSDQVGFSFCSKDFQRGSGWSRFRPVAEVTYDDIWDVISSVYQSNSTGLNTDTFCLQATSVRLPSGRGRARKYNNFDEECRKRGGIVVISNKDNMCLPRALMVAQAYVNKDLVRDKVRRDIGNLQTQRAFNLLEEAGVIIPLEGCGISELEKFQRVLHNYKIVVYMYDNKGRNVMFEGPDEGKKLNLLYHKGHFNVITSLTSAFCAKYYCEECHVPYDHKNKHRCGGSCPCCRQAPKCPQALNVKCPECNRSFRGMVCYHNHCREGSLGKGTVCSQIRLCTSCLRTVKSDRKHTCGEIFCKICYTHQPRGHLCFIQPDTGTPKTKDTLFIFYDFETMQEKLLEDGSKIHQPNLCVFSQSCDECIEKDIKLCNRCGVTLRVLRTSPVNIFAEHVFNQRKLFKQIICLAHNFQSFDGQFILNYILTQTDLKPELIMRGTKIISMVVGNVKFLDSLNYFPMPLSKLPKAFGLGPELKKGYFPHMFNTEGNKYYVGSLPAIEYYNPDTMKTEDREKFLNWYDEHKHDVFDMQRDLVEYCISDVEILKNACLKFRQQLLETSNVCPYSESCTLASCCSKVFRRNFLKQNTIGIIPKNGYRWRDNQSKIAIQWLVWEERQRQINIVQAAKQQETVVQGVRVDGYCVETKQVFEFQGCYYHGCPVCFKHSRHMPTYDNPTETMDSRYESTLVRTERLRELGYEVIEVWECRFRKMLKESAELRNYTEKHPLVALTPLNVRDAFYGGRTGNCYEYYRCQESEMTRYADICSLYPYVCKYGKFPVGHPKVFVGNDCGQLDLENTDGVIKCKIVPPMNLYHPVLPLKMNNKLLFALCYSCAKETYRGMCTHNNEERSLTGTWVIDEVLKAVEKGYEIQEIYEIWRYDTQQYDKDHTGLFTGMMDRFIKIKQQASGFPSTCVTLEQKDRYIEDFLNKEGVLLERDKVVNNPGLRALSKLMLNSFWGKFGQRENQAKAIIVRDPCELFNLFVNAGIYVNALVPIGEDTVIVNYEHIDEAYAPLSTVSVVVAAYVTAQARLKLYSYLEKLGERALYYDTDSVIYVSRPGEYDVPTGEFIGDMTDELESFGPGSYITEFVSGGPKNYAYKVCSTRDNDEKVVCKVKGLCLNYAASRLVNFDAIKDMVLNDAAPVYIVSNNIRRTEEHEVITKVETKIYRPCSTKRKFSSDHSSVPYGYKK